MKTLHLFTFSTSTYSIIIITSSLSSLICYQFNYIIAIGKHRRTNTIIDNRQLADDGLPYSDLKMYLNKLILRKVDAVDDDGNPISVKYSCGQRGCNALWTVKAGNSTTLNFRQHYNKFHPDKPFDSGIDSKASSALVRRLRTTIIDF